MSYSDDAVTATAQEMSKKHGLDEAVALQLIKDDIGGNPVKNIAIDIGNDFYPPLEQANSPEFSEYKAFKTLSESGASGTSPRIVVSRDINPSNRRYTHSMLMDFENGDKVIEINDISGVRAHKLRPEEKRKYAYFSFDDVNNLAGTIKSEALRLVKKGYFDIPFESDTRTQGSPRNKAETYGYLGELESTTESEWEVLIEKSDRSANIRNKVYANASERKAGRMEKASRYARSGQWKIDPESLYLVLNKAKELNNLGEDFGLALDNYAHQEAFEILLQDAYNSISKILIKENFPPEEDPIFSNPYENTWDINICKSNLESYNWYNIYSIIEELIDKYGADDYKLVIENDFISLRITNPAEKIDESGIHKAVHNPLAKYISLSEEIKKAGKLADAILEEAVLDNLGINHSEDDSLPQNYLLMAVEQLKSQKGYIDGMVQAMPQEHMMNSSTDNLTILARDMVRQKLIYDISRDSVGERLNQEYADLTARIEKYGV